MQLLKRVMLILILIIAALAAAIHFSGNNYIWRALKFTYFQGHSTAHIDDSSNFKQRQIPAGAMQAWPKSEKYNRAEVPTNTLAHLQKTKTAAFLIAQNGQLVHEQYFSPYTESSRTNSFSMAKSITTMLVGAAVADGYIKSIDEPIINYIPEYADNAQGKSATIGQLASMTSGHDWEENYFLPLNKTTDLYFGDDAEKTALGQGFERAPATQFEYSSASTQVLGIVLKRALQAKNPNLTISQYLSEKFWIPMGMEQAATWSLSGQGTKETEMTYCCVFSNARDFAKLGQLLLQNGNWTNSNAQLLSSQYVELMRQPNGLTPSYGHGLWMDWQYKHPFYAMVGHLGQYVIVVPKYNLVVVRLGQTNTPDKTISPSIRDEVYQYVDAAVQMAGH